MTGTEKTLPAEDSVEAARQQFAVRNMMLGAEVLRDTARHAVVKMARQHGWPCETQAETYDLLEKLDDSLALISGYMYAEGLPDKIRYRYDEIVEGEMETDCDVIEWFLAQLTGLTAAT